MITNKASKNCLQAAAEAPPDAAASAAVAITLTKGGKRSSHRLNWKITLGNHLLESRPNMLSGSPASL
jgi:hypothetical protein